MDVPTAVILAAAVALALKCLADLADARLTAERARVRREAAKAEGSPSLGVDDDVPPA